LQVNAVAGEAKLTLHGNLAIPDTPGRGEVSLCLKAPLPPGIIPPPDMVKQQVEAMQTMFTQQLKNFQCRTGSVKHTNMCETISYEGKNVILIKDPSSGINVGVTEEDFTPVGVGPMVDGDWTPLAKFTDWTEGAQIPDIGSCTDAASAELLAKPQFMQKLQQLDQLMALLRRMEPMRFNHFPAQPSLLFANAAVPQRSVQQSTPGMASTVMLAFAAGTLASLAVFAIMKPRRSHGEPLLHNLA